MCMLAFGRGIFGMGLGDGSEFIRSGKHSSYIVCPPAIVALPQTILLYIVRRKTLDAAAA